MPIPPPLQRKLQQTLGIEAGDSLVTYLDSIEAMRGDIAELRHALQRLDDKLLTFLGARDDKWAVIMKASEDKLTTLITANEEKLTTLITANEEKLTTLIKSNAETLTGLVATSEARTAAAIERGLKEQTRFFFLAWSVVLASIIGLYAR